MMISRLIRRCFSTSLAIAGAFALLTFVSSPAQAVNEGGSESLWKTLEDTSKGYYEAKEKLDASRGRQSELTAELGGMQTKVEALSEQANFIANAAYVDGPTAIFTAAMDSQSLTLFIEKMTFLDQFSWENAKTFNALQDSRKDLDSQKEAIDKEVVEQEKQEQALADKMAQAEQALANMGAVPSSGFTSGGKPAATPAPRGPDGSLPNESCTEGDPTTGGCLTPRTLHALNEAEKVGFTHYVSCYRSGGSGEHPQGRACDFAAASGGFGGAASGDDLLYGNRLAGWFVENAEPLGVLYVIWYKQIWMPGSGWSTYYGGGDPSSDHTNHVHLSIR